MFCHPGQRSVVPPLQLATPILSALNKWKMKNKYKLTVTHCNANTKILAPQMPPHNKCCRRWPPSLALTTFKILFIVYSVHGTSLLWKSTVNLGEWASSGVGAITNTLQPLHQWPSCNWVSEVYLCRWHLLDKGSTEVCRAGMLSLIGHGTYGRILPLLAA